MASAILIERIWVMMNGFDEFQKASKESMTKAMESYGALSKGLQAIAVESADFSKKSFEDGAAHMETLMGAKSFDVALEAQTDFVKSAYEGAVSQATKIGAGVAAVATGDWSNAGGALGGAMSVAGSLLSSGSGPATATGCMPEIATKAGRGGQPNFPPGLVACGGFSS